LKNRAAPVAGVMVGKGNSVGVIAWSGAIALAGATAWSVACSFTVNLFVVASYATVVSDLDVAYVKAGSASCLVREARIEVVKGGAVIVSVVATVDCVLSSADASVMGTGGWSGVHRCSMTELDGGILWVAT